MARRTAPRIRKWIRALIHWLRRPARHLPSLLPARTRLKPRTDFRREHDGASPKCRTTRPQGTMRSSPVSGSGRSPACTAASRSRPQSFHTTMRAARDRAAGARIAAAAGRVGSTRNGLELSRCPAVERQRSKLMTNIDPKNPGKEDLTRVDPYREDEATGGAAAPPLRPRTSSAQKPDMPDELSKRPKGPAQP